jgi:ABC-type nitrate/sulfonate/bicarbonate transport system substrate-binding protein
MKLVTILLLCMVCTASFAKVEMQKVRLGWQVPWAIQGQIVQIFKHTDILAKNHIEAEFIGKTFGPELNELAVAGAVDVILTADQPAAVLFSKDKGWVGFSRLMYNRTATYVPVKSTINSLADLKGKTLGVPFGAAAERVTSEGLTEINLVPKTDVTYVNLAMPEHMALVKKTDKEALKFDQFDALSGFDPAPAIMEAAGLVKTIHSGKVIAMALAQKEFLTKNKGFSKNFKNAIVEAYEYYNKNEAEVNKWFLEEAKMIDIPEATWTLVKKYETNFLAKKKKDIKVNFSKEDFELMQKGANFVEKATNKKIAMKDFVSNEY